ncbi:hypothetical protein [Nonomuraea aridisoli]|uniref:Uncharacterized protein n=1 Tax=Nonomuraea aridisoli TaxID=2070368 RepID=A0A2W2E6K0_9ACTN|nr:hypothetical protein [Nonomuraea aridisoli]PZG19916.1 hypothetical protein C1J01_10775 [Nonomuraea aridisoli]
MRLDIRPLARPGTRLTLLRDLVCDLVLNPKLVTFVRADGKVLLSDRYTVWDLAKVRLDVDGVNISAAHLPGLPPDGTYTWHRTRAPELLDRRPALNLAGKWIKYSSTDGKPLRTVEWSPWSCDGARIGELRGRPVAVNGDWLTRVTERFPCYRTAGRRPAQHLDVLDDHMPGEVVGVIASMRLAPALDVDSLLLAEVVDHGVGWGARRRSRKNAA